MTVASELQLRWDDRVSIGARARRWLLILVAAALAACAKHPPPLSPLHATPITVLPFSGEVNERLATSTTMTKPLRGVIRNPTAWGVFWARVENDSTTVQTVQPPTVDFSREMLLVAGDGKRPRGHRVEIPGAALRNDTLFVLVRSRDEVTTAGSAPLAPVAVVRVPRMDGPVVFRSDQAPPGPPARP